VLTSVCSVLASACIAAGIVYGLLNDTMGRNAWLVTFCTPLLISPAASWALLRLVLQVDQAQEELRELSLRDPLTGCYNRRHFMHVLRHEVGRSRRYGQAASVAILDVDNFKQINDRLGHQAGDEVLLQVAQACQSVMRDTDVFARIGGEEFAVLLPQTNALEAHALVERLRLHVQTLPLAQPVTVSVGVVGAHATDHVDAVMQAADHAMYRAKREGKNRVVLAELADPMPQVSG
jgi:diguanylate cyclase (GGDEF)-like protein